MRWPRHIPSPSAALTACVCSGFDFYDQADPTNGMVDYVDAEEAFRSNLTFVNDQGQAVIRVDKTTQLQAGEYRKS